MVSSRLYTPYLRAGVGIGPRPPIVMIYNASPPIDEHCLKLSRKNFVRKARIKGFVYGSYMVDMKLHRRESENVKQETDCKKK